MGFLRFTLQFNRVSKRLEAILKCRVKYLKKNILLYSEEELLRSSHLILIGGGGITLVLDIIFFSHWSLAFYFVRRTVFEFFQPGACI